MFLIYLIIEKVNLLDLDNDVLNIIGDYVKADNIERIKEEKQNQKMKLFQFVDEEMKKVKKNARKKKEKLIKEELVDHIRLIFDRFFFIDNQAMLEEYLKLKKLFLYA